MYLKLVCLLVIVIRDVMVMRLMVGKGGGWDVVGVVKVPSDGSVLDVSFW